MAHLTVHLDDFLFQAQWLLEAISTQNMPAVKSMTEQILKKNGCIQDIVRQCPLTIQLPTDSLKSND
jgi:hypothetical protein